MERCLIDFHLRQSSSSPTLGVFCEDIGQVEHATRVLSGTDNGKSVLGTKATFTCDANYRMPEVGDAERTCQQDGTWSGTQPRCVGKFCQSTVNITIIQPCTSVLLTFPKHLSLKG